MNDESTAVVMVVTVCLFLSGLMFNIRSCESEKRSLRIECVKAGKSEDTCIKIIN